MRKFDYSFLDNGNLPASLVNTVGGIYAWRTSTDARKNEHAQLFTALEKVAKVQSVKTSNAIEGIVASDQRIKEIVNQNSAPRDHDEEEIEGYRDTLNKVHTEYDHLNFREKDILLLHETMMTPAKDPLAGKYKQTDNVIVEIDSQGRINLSRKAVLDEMDGVEKPIESYVSRPKTSGGDRGHGDRGRGGRDRGGDRRRR